MNSCHLPFDTVCMGVLRPQCWLSSGARTSGLAVVAVPAQWTGSSRVSCGLIQVQRRFLINSLGEAALAIRPTRRITAPRRLFCMDLASLTSLIYYLVCLSAQTGFPSVPLVGCALRNVIVCFQSPSRGAGFLSWHSLGNTEVIKAVPRGQYAGMMHLE